MHHNCSKCTLLEHVAKLDNTITVKRLTSIIHPTVLLTNLSKTLNLDGTATEFLTNFVSFPANTTTPMKRKII